MVHINLLPTAYRKPQASSAQQFIRSPLAFLVAGCLAGVSVLLVVVAQMRQATLVNLEVQIRELEPKRKSIDDLRKTVEMLREQKGLLETVVKSRSQWARRLNQLSNVTPDGVWFTDLLIDGEKGLVLQGSAVGQGGAEMVQIGRLAQDLKSDATFSSAVRDIQIQSIESVQEQETEVVKFTLTGMLSQLPVQSPKQ
jgi:Tfp pilus assembly protein PilN